MNSTKIYIACDHAGFELKTHLLHKLSDLNWSDLGTFNNKRVDYPDYASKLSKAVLADLSAMGVLVCGSGQGMAMRANKYSNIRAALCWTPEVAELSRQHNDANVLCLGSRVMDHKLCEKIVIAFLQSKFEGGRHQQRVEKIGEKT